MAPVTKSRPRSRTPEVPTTVPGKGQPPTTKPAWKVSFDVGESRTLREAKCCGRSGDQTLATQLLGRAGRVGGDSLYQHIECRHGRARGTCHGHALALRGHVLEVDAGDAAQLRHQSLQDNGADLAGKRHRQVAHGGRNCDALRDQLGLCCRPDAPYLADGVRLIT